MAGEKLVRLGKDGLPRKGISRKQYITALGRRKWNGLICRFGLKVSKSLSFLQIMSICRLSRSEGILSSMYSISLSGRNYHSSWNLRSMWNVELQRVTFLHFYFRFLRRLSLPEGTNCLSLVMKPFTSSITASWSFKKSFITRLYRWLWYPTNQHFRRSARDLLVASLCVTIVTPFQSTFQKRKHKCQKLRMFMGTKIIPFF